MVCGTALCCADGQRARTPSVWRNIGDAVNCYRVACYHEIITRTIQKGGGSIRHIRRGLHDILTYFWLEHLSVIRLLIIREKSTAFPEWICITYPIELPMVDEISILFYEILHRSDLLLKVTVNTN